MIDLSGVAHEVFQLLRSYDYAVMLYDDEGKRVTEPEDARRMFARPANLLISLVDEGDDSAVRLYVGKSTDIKDIMGLVNALRSASSKFNLLFNMRRYGREINLKDFTTKASVREAREHASMAIELTEGMYGTSRSSYLTLENARMIVRHSARIEPDRIGARGRNVDRIFVEDRQGQRFLFPTTHLAPARAMTQHLNQGGAVDDETGKRINEAAEEYAALSKASRHVLYNGAHLNEQAHEVREACRCKMKEMRRMFERLYRPSAYADEASKMPDNGTVLIEDDMTARLDEMRQTLAVEGHDLDDRVYEAACRAVMEVTEKGKREKIGPMVSVLGKPVSKEAWEALKLGNLDLISEPKLTDDRGNSAAPSFMSRDDEVMFKLRAVSQVCKDDSMLNFLGYVADEMPEQSDPQRKKLFRSVAVAALKAAGLSMSDGAPKTEAVMEFLAWVKTLGSDVLMEMPYPDNYSSYGAPDSGDDGYDDAVDEMITDFDPMDFLSSESADDFDWQYREHMSADPEDRTYDMSYFISSLVGYLQRYLSLHHDVHDPGDLTDVAKMLFPKVRPHLEAAGYIVRDPASPVAESEELTREDVLLPPKNKGLDLKREVTKRQTDEPDPADLGKKGTLVDDDYVSRMRTLAGMR